MGKLLSGIINTAAGLAQKTNAGVSGSRELSAQLRETARDVAAQGAVMLKNNGALPLRGKTVSVFGRTQIDWFYVGYGSGGDVQTPEKTSLLAGLRKVPEITLDTKLASQYEQWCAKNTPDEGFWGHWPKNYPEMPLTAQNVRDAARVSQTAVYNIGRAAGEDSDTDLRKGSYYLTDEETDILDKLTASFDEVVVLINAGAVMDMSALGKYGDKISAIVYVWQGGMVSGDAVADVLSGRASPGGKLADTIARRYEDYPCSGNFGDSGYNNYVEDIYVGYRYFETFRKDAVLYPFGFGLSYTQFDIAVSSVELEEDIVKAAVTVTNTGEEYSGRETVQMYFSAPQGVMGKPSRELAAFCKTKELMPGESENITLTFPVSQASSYDDAGKTGHKSAYVLEAGDYGIYIGNSVRAAKCVYTFNIPQLRVVRQLTEAAAVEPEHAFERLCARQTENGIEACYEKTPVVSHSRRDNILRALPDEIARTGDRGITLAQVATGEADIREFTAQLDDIELEALSRGDYTMNSPLGALGNAGVLGGVEQSLRDKGIAPLTATDGPSGIRLKKYASLLPDGAALASSWNPGLVRELYRLLGAEMREKGSDILLGPGMNIHRSPLCGRNFEYYSEDPLLTGVTAAAFVEGVQSSGVAACPKHFACNNQEKNRNRNDSRVSERALREIYLRGFEICVTQAKPLCIMTSYNKINGVWGHYHYELCNTILRGEWGFDGCVMTDWWMRPSRDPDFELLYDNAYRVRAGVNVLMPGGKRTSKRKYDKSLCDSLGKSGGITLGELQKNAQDVLTLVMRLKSGE